MSWNTIFPFLISWKQISNLFCIKQRDRKKKAHYQRKESPWWHIVLMAYSIHLTVSVPTMFPRVWMLSCWCVCQWLSVCCKGTYVSNKSESEHEWQLIRDVSDCVNERHQMCVSAWAIRADSFVWDQTWMPVQLLGLNKFHEGDLWQGLACPKNTSICSFSVCAGVCVCSNVLFAHCLSLNRRLEWHRQEKDGHVNEVQLRDCLLALSPLLYGLGGTWACVFLSDCVHFLDW